MKELFLTSQYKYNPLIHPEPIIYFNIKNKGESNMAENNKNYKFEKLSRDEEDKTKIMAGHTVFTVKQLEDEIKSDSEIGRKLKSIEQELDKY